MLSRRIPRFCNTEVFSLIYILLHSRHGIIGFQGCNFSRSGLTSSAEKAVLLIFYQPGQFCMVLCTGSMPVIVQQFFLCWEYVLQTASMTWLVCYEISQCRERQLSVVHFSWNDEINQQKENRISLLQKTFATLLTVSNLLNYIKEALKKETLREMSVHVCPSSRTRFSSFTAKCWMYIFMAVLT